MHKYIHVYKSPLQRILKSDRQPSPVNTWRTRE